MKQGGESGATNTQYFCKNCGEFFTSKDDFMYHCTSVHKLLTCDLCCRTYTTMAGLNIHKKMHLGEKGGCPKCPVCGRILPGLSYLKRHMLKHSDYKAFSCDKCGKSYKSKYDLSYHVCKG